MVRQRNLTPIYAGSNPARVVCNKWLHITLRMVNNMDGSKAVEDICNSLKALDSQKAILKKNR